MNGRDFFGLLIRDRATLVARAQRSDAARHIEDLFFRLRSPDIPVVNGLEICVLGMRRCGNHAVTNWLEHLGSTLGQVVFLNNLAPRDNGYRHRLWYTEDLSRHQHEIFRRCRAKKFPKDGIGLLIRSYEDLSVANFLDGLENDFHYGRSRRRVFVVNYRDPLNLFASRVKSGYTAVIDLDQVRLYQDHFHAARSHPAVIGVDFNAFVASADYRKVLAGRLGLPFSDFDPISKISGHGGGSSFGKEFSVELLLSRFTGMLQNPHFQRLINEPAIRAIVQDAYPQLYAKAYTA